MNIAHTDLKPGDRFRLTVVEGPDERGLTSTTIWEGTVDHVNAGGVFCGPEDYDYLVDHDDAMWERLAPAEPKNLGAVVEFTNDEGDTLSAVRTHNGFRTSRSDQITTWRSLLAVDANPRVLHEGWDGK